MTALKKDFNMEKMALAIKDILYSSGKIALEKQRDVSFWSKSDESPVSELDIEVTELVKKKLANFLSMPNHCLIDEETPDSHGLNSEYIWVLDPIGGTKSYINQLPFWGNYLGLLKNNKPYMGGVYIPAMGELFLYDGRKASYMRNAFKDTAETINIEASNIVKLYDKNKIIFMSRNYKSDVFNVLDGGSLAINLCYPLIGRGIAAVTRSYLWDICGVWAIAKEAGFGFFEIDTGKELEEFSNKSFDEDLRLRSSHILCRPQDFEILQRGIAPTDI